MKENWEFKALRLHKRLYFKYKGLEDKNSETAKLCRERMTRISEKLVTE